MKRYNVLFFDLDDTLLDTTGDEIRTIEKVFGDYSIPYSSDVADIYKNKTDWQTYTLGELSVKAEFTNKFCQLLDMLLIKDNRKEMVDDYFETFQKTRKVVPSAVKVLTALKKQGYKIYLTTNGYSDVQRKRLKLARLEKFFDGIFISGDFDLRKPSKAYFDYVFGRIPESNRSKVLVIGDAQSTDILGAKNAGFDSCWFNPSRQAPKYNSTYEVNNMNDLFNLLDKNKQ